MKQKEERIAIKTKLYISQSRSVFYNLALEEWALKSLDTSNTTYLILYVNAPSVVVGRNQNIFEEVNLSYCKQNNIEVARRISGGGTVFHDLGNLNWSLISSFSTDKVNNYVWASKTIFDLLKSYHLAPYLTDRNAIEVNQVKLSGQAQFTNRKNILSHGTLLVNSNLKLMQPSIESLNEDKIQSKASKSVRSITENLSTLIQSEITVFDVISRMENDFNFDKINFHLNEFNPQSLTGIDWVYARSPKFTVLHQVGDEEVKLTVVKGKIENIENKKGYQLIDSPLRNILYNDYLLK